MELVLDLKTLKKDTPWDFKKLSELIVEIAVQSNDYSIDSLLPLIFSAIDLAKKSAFSKLGQEVSLNDPDYVEVSKMFDELKVVAKFAAPAVVKSLTVKKLVFALSSCCSGVSVLKAIDQKASQQDVEKKLEEKKVEEKKVEEKKVEEKKVEEKKVEEKKVEKKTEKKVEKKNSELV